MSPREKNLLWLRDLLEHLSNSQQQLEWAEDPDAAHVITETMLRDLDCCRRICENLQRRSRQPVAV